MDVNITQGSSCDSPSHELMVGLGIITAELDSSAFFMPVATSFPSATMIILPLNMDVDVGGN